MKTLALLISLAALASSAGAQSAPTVPIRLTLAAQGNQARFVVREQLAGAELPNDAVGVTSAITGGITLDARGMVDSSARSEERRVGKGCRSSWSASLSKQ